MAQKLNVPYLSRLEGGGLQPGQTVFLKGIKQGDNFSVSFLTSQNHESGDAALLLLAHGKDKQILMNDRSGGKTGKDEKVKFAVKDGEHVDLRFRAHDNKFTVYLNLKEVAQFEYRQPLSAINHIFVDGNLELHEVNWGGKYYPVPYQAGIDGGFTPGKKLIVCGVPEKKVDNFKIDFLTADGQIAFHFNPRFGKKNVIRNSYLNGAWGTEEAEGKFPFVSDLAFDISIVNEPYAFQVFINGTHFCAFAHRIEPTSIKGLRIEGDVELHGVHVK